MTGKRLKRSALGFFFAFIIAPLFTTTGCYLLDDGTYGKLTEDINVISFSSQTGPLEVTSTQPVDSATNAGVISVIVFFNHNNIDITTINSTTFAISPSIAGTYYKSPTFVSFTPQPSKLAYNTTYTVTITAGGIKDMMGNSLVADYQFSFTTKLPPALGVTSTYPSNNAVRVRGNICPSINFNNNIDNTTVNSTNICISPSIPLSFSIFGSYVAYCCSPAPATTYTVTVKAAGVKDTYGGSLASDYVFSFTTSSAPTSGLVGAWFFDNYGDYDWDDSGYSNYLSASGTIALLPDRYGQLSSSYQLTNNRRLYSTTWNSLPTGNANRTISAWFMINNFPAINYSPLTGYGQCGTNNTFYSIGVYNPTKHLYFTQWGSSIFGSTTLSTGVWYHVVVVNSSNNVTLYLNGATDGTGTATINTTGAEVFMGMDSCESYYFDGAIDDVRIYNRALSGAEILSLYNE